MFESLYILWFVTTVRVLLTNHSKRPPEGLADSRAHPRPLSGVSHRNVLHGGYSFSPKAYS